MCKAQIPQGKSLGLLSTLFARGHQSTLATCLSLLTGFLCRFKEFYYIPVIDQLQQQQSSVMPDRQLSLLVPVELTYDTD